MRFREKKNGAIRDPSHLQESAGIFEVNVMCAFIMHTLSAGSQYLDPSNTVQGLLGKSF